MDGIICVIILIFIQINANVVVLETEMNNRQRIPTLAFGTAVPAETVADMVREAILAGFRHIDAATHYKNEVQVGQAIAKVIEEGLVKREELFITTKLWRNRHARNQVIPALRDSLQMLDLEYVDLYLIHYPTSTQPPNIDYLETWQGMEDALKMGFTKSIGVSNFQVNDINRLIENGIVSPAVNQIEVSPTKTQETLVNRCIELGITVAAYTPFGFLVPRRRHKKVSVNTTNIEKIARNYNKTVHQVVLRYLLDRRAIPIVMASSNKHLLENINVFDFRVTPNEIDTINKMNMNLAVYD